MGFIKIIYCERFSTWLISLYVTDILLNVKLDYFSVFLSANYENVIEYILLPIIRSINALLSKLSLCLAKYHAMKEYP